jgi:hypothetical protein
MQGSAYQYLIKQLLGRIELLQSRPSMIVITEVKEPRTSTSSRGFKRLVEPLRRALLAIISISTVMQRGHIYLLIEVPMDSRMLTKEKYQSLSVWVNRPS